MSELIEIENIKGRIINIQHYCYQDGPGVRTTVFVKGCSLQCKWCSNPESIHSELQVSYDKKECLGAKKCGRCMGTAFPSGLFTPESEKDDRMKVDWTRIKEWDAENAYLCPTGAISTYGKAVTAKEVIDEVDQDYTFYTGSKGGITVSGGEPLLQPEFTAALLMLAHKHGYTTAIESAFNVPWENVEKVLPHVDTVIHDIKHIEPEEHKNWTGVRNDRILENLKKAYETYPEKMFVARTPLIPGVNDSEEVIDKILAFILPHKNVVNYELMPYHRLGLGKYDSIGKEYEMSEIKPPDEAFVRKLREKIKLAFIKRD